MKRLRIACVIYGLGGGGAERNLVRLADWLSKLGHHVTILTHNSNVKDFYKVPEGVARRMAPLDAEISYRWYRLLRLRRQITAFRRFILEGQPEVVISFIDTTNVKVLMALRFSNIPVIVSERIDPRQHRIQWKWMFLRRVFYPRAAQVVIVAQEILQWATKLWPKWKVSVIPNVVLPPVVPQLCARPEWFASKNIVAMGRLNKQKGFDILLCAFSRIGAEFADWNLTIIGEGHERSNLENQISSLGLEGRVYMPGQIAEPSEILSQADIFILSSLYEGFPNALAEAMAIGLPVISFDCPTGPKEIIRNDIDGILVPAGDMNGLSEAMKRLMADEGERKRLASRAPDVLDRYSPQRIIDMWQTVVDDSVRRSNS